jgi:hypothetical protein
MENWKGEQYEEIRERAFRHTEFMYGFDASRERMTWIIKEVA